MMPLFTFSKAAKCHLAVLTASICFGVAASAYGAESAAAPAPSAGSVSNSNLNYGKTKPQAPAAATIAPQKPSAPAVTQNKPAAKSPNLSGDQRTELKRVEAYLNSINTLVADFTQVAPDGSLASGKFYLKRPGKMRWQYEPPTPVLVISNGGTLVYYDYELEQVTHLPIDSSLASVLARKHISLSDPDLVIDELSTSPGAVRLKLSQRGKREEGALLMEFADQPLRIRNLIVTDAQGQTTTVALNNARFGVPLESSLFVWKDPRQKR